MAMTATQTMHQTKIDIDENNRRQLVELLNHHLADTFDLYSQSKQAHWNVKGMDFYALHKLFDDVAEAVEPFVDTVAERVTALGGTAQGTLRMAAEASSLPEYPADLDSGEAHIRALVDRFSAYAKRCREGISRSEELGDMTTADLFTEISRAVDLKLYFLESHLQG